MKNIFTILFILIFSLSQQIFSQDIDNNLKGLDLVKIKVVDDQNLLPETSVQKLITETKLQLLSAGIKNGNADDNCATLQMKVRGIESKMAAHRILVQLFLTEPIKTTRKSSSKIEAITYYEDAFYVDSYIASSALRKLKDELLIHFINRFLDEKASK